MADSFVQLPADSTGKKIDTRTEATNSEHRQVFVIGDPATNAGVAPVDATKGLAVDLTATGANATAIKVDGSAVTQPVSGTVTVQQATAANLKVDLSGTGANATAVKVDGSAVTQPVSGTVTTTQGTAAADTAAWPVKFGVVAATTAAWTSATAGNTTLSLATSDYSTVILTLRASSTMTAGLISFQVSDDGGTNWYAVEINRIGSFIQESQFPLAVVNQAWVADVAGYTNFRVILTTGITGSGTANLRLQATAGEAEGGVNAGMNLGRKVTYITNTGPITGATATGLKSLAYIFHASSIQPRYEIVRIHVNQIAGQGGSQRIELNRITAENGTPGGTTTTINPKDPGDAASGATVRFGANAPTRAAGVYDGGDVPVTGTGNMDFPSSNPLGMIEVKPLACRTATAEGWEIAQNVITTITTAPSFNITIEWIEIGGVA